MPSSTVQPLQNAFVDPYRDEIEKGKLYNLAQGLAIPNFEASSAILNPHNFSVVSASWNLDLCVARLNHAIFWKDRHEETIFLFFIRFWKLSYIYCYLLDGVALDLDCIILVRYEKYLANSLIFSFSYTTHLTYGNWTWFIINCLTDTSRKSSYVLNGIFAYLIILINPMINIINSSSLR